ncbi:symmetrical bis(5'-nucleosyl)-tetraphosphatase [Nitrosomonas supralitoralis]|uniref:Bis(5'-nucleosyl)-tetraphosphatase, symmetrical n=1 Tax=Nitrosomonas supralitoralis TaxID=2116706 RepID=A0A2P7NXP1_9PROT|nr:symmetrical bis(5'-nucleosyl)-tetraphosphatase [Nitrosomonas supralitoralis]PSJ18217.1 diadenosine tetraphosphatase [Nitrosomonas supralitoralis]
MATYAIGDLQGCFTAFQRLIELIRFDPVQDKLWLVGDIVNRGPDSLSLLRYIKQAGDVILMVLGNHDLHLLMVAAGKAKNHPSDTIQPILDAPDRDELLHWLRHQKLFHAEGQYAMVHAGLLPSWSVSQAEQLAREVESALQQDNFQELLALMYGNDPDHWQNEWTDHRRLRVIINAMTRMRVCTLEGKMNFTYKGNIQSIPFGYFPWFSIPHRLSQNSTVICGHWSALGLYLTDNLIALDTGCVWGGQLTAIRLEDRKVFQLPCAR